jgi:hypothetical protein
MQEVERVTKITCVCVHSRYLFFLSSCVCVHLACVILNSNLTKTSASFHSSPTVVMYYLKREFSCCTCMYVHLQCCNLQLSCEVIIV